MGTIRKQRSSKEKAKIAIEALRDTETLVDLSRKHGVHAIQVGKWRKELLERAYEVFEGSSERKKSLSSESEDELLKTIGKLKVENDFLKKNLSLSLEAKREAIEENHPYLSILEQCKTLSLCRSQYYYDPVPVSPLNHALMKRIDEIHTDLPFYGSRKMCAHLLKEGHHVNRKRIQRLMRLMGIEPLYCKQKTTVRNKEHEVYPYLLRGVPIVRNNQVWSIDITYIRMQSGFLYLVAVIDWFSRFVLSWRLSNQMGVAFCIDALIDAFKYGTPHIFNSDQGVQFTSLEFIKELKQRKINISMDGKGRAIDNVFIERLWRSVKYEEVYLKEYANGTDAFKNLKDYFSFYNNKRIHQALDYKTPSEVFVH